MMSFPVYIFLGLLLGPSGLISEMLFTILVAMAIITSLTAGPWLRYLQKKIV